MSRGGGDESDGMHPNAKGLRDREEEATKRLKSDSLVHRRR